MGTPWWVYLILVIGIIIFFGVVRSIIGQLRSQYKIKEHDKFKVTAEGRQQLDMLPEGSTSHSLEQHLLQFFASSEEGRRVGDIPAEISQKEVEEEYREWLRQVMSPKNGEERFREELRKEFRRNHRQAAEKLEFDRDLQQANFQPFLQKMTEMATTGLTFSEEQYWEEIKQTIASLENKGYVQQILKWNQLKKWLVEQ